MSVFHAQTRDEGIAQLGSKSRKIRSVERRCGTVVVTVNALIQKGWRDGQNKQPPASGSPCSPRGPGQIRKRFLRGAGRSPLPRSLINRCEFTEWEWSVEGIILQELYSSGFFLSKDIP